jgi:dinuclear metal center YbgI/SA1388 family protein
MKVCEIVKVLETVAPLSLAAEWDNVGLLAGDGESGVKKLLLCIDLTEQVLSEALKAGADMVMAYHPLIFKNVSRVTAESSPVLHAALRQGLAVHSLHTALDAAPGGVNDVLADVLGLLDRRTLEPSVDRSQCKIVTFVPADDLSRVAEAAFSAGAGRVGEYFDCAFFGHGVGAFCALPGTHPKVGRAGRHEATEEMRLEIVAPRSKASGVCAAIRSAHGYEEPVVEMYPIETYPAACGMGRVGRLAKPLGVDALVAKIKKATGLSRLMLAKSPVKEKVRVAACCGGSCGDLFHDAIACGATFYLTGEMRHHDALAAVAAGMTVACLGHSNSERIALTHLADRLGKALPKLRVMLSRYDKDPFEIV